MTLTDQSLMPFGKFKGTKMANVPADYLLWLHGAMEKQSELSPEKYSVLIYCSANMEVLQQEKKRNQ